VKRAIINPRANKQLVSIVEKAKQDVFEMLGSASARSVLKVGASALSPSIALAGRRELKSTFSMTNDDRLGH
jgi:hypothetical protein